MIKFRSDTSPASEEEIDKLFDYLNFSIPEQFEALLRKHNGGEIEWPHPYIVTLDDEDEALELSYIFSATEIIETMKIIDECELESEGYRQDANFKFKSLKHRKLIPFGSDGGGNHFFLYPKSDNWEVMYHSHELFMDYDEEDIYLNMDLNTMINNLIYED